MERDAVNRSLIANEKINNMVGEERSCLLARMATHTNKFPIIAAMMIIISIHAVTRRKVREGAVELWVLKFVS